MVKGKERILYERRLVGSDLQVKPQPALKAGTKLKALCSIGGPSNQSFLATVKATLEKSDVGAELLGVLRWFSRTLQTIAPDETFGPLGHNLSSDPAFLDFAGNFLKAASTGIDSLEVQKKKLTEEEFRKELPETVLSQLLGSSAGPMEKGAALIRSSSGQEFMVDRKRKQFYHIAIQSKHLSSSGAPVTFALADESDGTRRLLDLVPTLHRNSKEDTVCVIDEIDRSLHPIMVHNYLDFFLKTCASEHDQIIVTTHESNLLDLDLLRRDEIWFAEKDKESCSHLYSLNEFKVRNDLEIRRHYLQGRFGAIPFLGNLAKLTEVSERCLDEQEAAAAS